MLDSLGPLVDNPNMTKALLDDLPRTSRLLTSLQEMLEKPEVKELIGEYFIHTGGGVYSSFLRGGKYPACQNKV